MEEIKPMSNVIDIQKYACNFLEEQGNLSKIIKLKINEKEYFYKENEIFNGNSYPLNIAEVLMCYYMSNLGVNNFTKYYFAKNGENSSGVISESFISENNIREHNTIDILTYYIANRKYHSIFKIKDASLQKSKKNVLEALSKQCNGVNLNSVEMILEITNEFCATNNIIFDKEKFQKQLLQITIIDYFSSNADRNISNLLFFIINNNEGKPEIQVGPIFDNGYCLGIRDFYWQKYNGIEPKINNFTYLALGISKKSQITPFNEYNNEMFIKDLIKAIKPHPDLINLVKNCLEFNMSNLISSFEEAEDIKLDYDLTQFIIKTYNKRVENFRTCFNKTNTFKKDNDLHKAP